MSDDKMYPVTEKFVSCICDGDKLRIAWFERKSSSMRRQRLDISLCDFLDVDHILSMSNEDNSSAACDRSKFKGMSVNKINLTVKPFLRGKSYLITK